MGEKIFSFGKRIGRRAALLAAAVCCIVHSGYANNNVFIESGKDKKNESYILKCPYQDLEAVITPHRISIKSVSESEGRGDFYLSLKKIFRKKGDCIDLTDGRYEINKAGRNSVIIKKEGVIEKYRSSTDGIVQDFILTERVGGKGKLILAVEVKNADIISAVNGVTLKMKCGRKLTYNKIRVSDHNKRILCAKIFKFADSMIGICIDDKNAEYPLFVDPTISDSDWSAVFSSCDGTNAPVYSIVKNSKNEIFIGGEFLGAGDNGNLNHIAKWNGSSWEALGQGLNGTVYALTFDQNGTLIAGGDFTKDGTGSTTLNYIAKWNGNSWEALGNGISGDSPVVHSLTFDENGTLIAGGHFTQAGGTNCNNIAKWNGNSWEALGNGISGDSPVVHSLTFDENGTLIAGGHFTQAGGTNCNNIAKWNGMSWENLGDGVDGDVFALTFDENGTLIAGGHFTQAGGTNCNNIAKWNGGSWEALGNGITGDYPVVRTLTFDQNGTLIVGGDFSQAGSASCNDIAKWDPTTETWSSMGNGITGYGEIYSLTFDQNGTLIAGGDFSEADGSNCNNIAKWDGSSWKQFYNNPNIDGQVETILFPPGSSDIYIGGEFENIYGTSCNHIAKWDGSSWSALGAGFNCTVYAMGIDPSGNLYAAGSFSHDGTGQTTLNHIAKWNGSSWENLGDGVDGDVFALTFDENGTLIAGGNFTTAGGVQSNKIAKWDPTKETWSSMGQGVTDPSWGSVSTLTFDQNGTLIAGGFFSEMDGVSCPNIAQWDPTKETWSSMANGFNGSVSFVTTDPNTGTIYAGGYFIYDSSWTQQLNHIAKWNGSSWENLGAGLDGEVVGLTFDENGTLIAGGAFTASGSTTCNYVAWYDSSSNSWQPLGSGTNGRVETLAYSTAYGDLYVGGNFTSAGGQTSMYLARCNIVTKYSISGTVTGDIKEGVTVKLTGKASATTTTNANGNYIFVGLKSGSYTVTPSKDGYTFTPKNRNVTIVDSDITDQDFEAKKPTYMISGYVQPCSEFPDSPVEDIKITLSGDSSEETYTNSSGYYEFTGLGDGNYTVTTEDKTEYYFNPESRNVEINGASQSDVNFTICPYIKLIMAVNPTEGGSTNPTQGTTLYIQQDNRQQDITATPADGYVFTGWTASPETNAEFADANSANTKVTVKGNVTVTANFTLQSSMLTVTMQANPSAGGTTSPAAGSSVKVAQNSSLSISASAAAGYNFAGWTASPSGAAVFEDASSTSTKAKITANVTITATFTKWSGEPYTLTMACSPSDGGQTTPSVGTHSVFAGIAQKIEATAASGYKFSGWRATAGATIADSSSSSTTVTLNDNATVTALFVSENTNITSMTIEKLNIALNGAKESADSVKFSAILPDTASFNPETDDLKVMIGNWEIIISGGNESWKQKKDKYMYNAKTDNGEKISVKYDASSYKITVMVRKTSVAGKLNPATSLEVYVQMGNVLYKDTVTPNEKTVWKYVSSTNKGGFSCNIRKISLRWFFRAGDDTAKLLFRISGDQISDPYNGNYDENVVPYVYLDQEQWEFNPEEPCVKKSKYTYKIKDENGIRLASFDFGKGKWLCFVKQTYTENPVLNVSRTGNIRCIIKFVSGSGEEKYSVFNISTNPKTIITYKKPKKE